MTVEERSLLPADLEAVHELLLKTSARFDAFSSDGQFGGSI